MYYAPHTLQKQVKPAEEVDMYGRPIVITNSETWVDVCKCRCDHNVDTEIKLEDGTIIRPEYHVVCDGNKLGVVVGDNVRCLREDGSIRGEGRVVRPRTLNYLPYGEFYI